MKKFIKRIVLLTALLFGFVVAYSYFCDWFFASPQYFDIGDNKRAWSLYQQNGQYDAVVLGSSRAFGSFDMSQLSTLWKQNIINLGANGSGYVDNYLVLYQFLKNRNDVKELLLQVDIYSLDSKRSFSNAFHTFQFLPYWHDPVIQSGISEYLAPREKILWNYIPALRYFKYNKYFSPKEVLRRYSLKSKKSAFDQSLGGPTANSPLLRDNADKEINPEFRSLDETDIEYLEKIIQLCRDHGIKLIAYRAPELISNQQKIKNYPELHDRIQHLLTDANVAYVQPNPLMETDATLFSDPIHLNRKGMTAFTESFSAAIEHLRATP